MSDELMGFLINQFSQVKDRLETIDKNLSEHMRRTDLVEKGQARADEYIELLRKDFAPIKTHVAVVGATAKVLAGIAAACAALAAITTLALRFI